MNDLKQLKKALDKAGSSKQAKILQRFFKTGPGEYGEGDVFLGIKVPEQRKIAAQYPDLSLADIKKILQAKYHEYRLCGLIILVNQFKKALPGRQKKIFDFYLRNARGINNWDLVDLSAYQIVGAYLFDRPRDVLYELARANNLWQRRIAVVACFAFIRNNDFKDILRLARILLSDEQDLMHKAVGWMLRELGKRDERELLKFLDKYYNKMPRIMLRYSIERLPEALRQEYLKK